MEKRTMMAQLASVSEGALGKLASSDLSKSALQGAWPSRSGSSGW